MLPSWIQAWQASPKQGLVVWQCRYLCGGAGDRIKGLTSAFVDAARAGADFRIDWTYPVHISEVLDSDYYLRAEPSRPSSSSLAVHAIDRPYPSCAWRRTLSAGGRINLRTNMFATDRDACSGAFAFPNGYASMSVVHEVFHFFFRPKPHILPHHNCKRCLHLRFGDATLLTPSSSRHDEERDALAFVLARRREDVPASQCLYVATDSRTLQTTLSTTHPPSSIRVDDDAPSHVDRGGGRRAVRSTWRSILALASCETIIQWRRSGFSNLAAAIGNATLCQDSIPSCMAAPRQTEWIGGG